MTYSEVLKKSLEADLLFSLRDKKPLVNTFICGSKFLESIMLGKPILVNEGTSAAIRVLKHKCGLIVDANNIAEIEAAIKYIKENPDVCKLLGTNGKNAYKLYYDWQIMKQRLITLYQELTERA
jgi:glycosyltransferase involved in cell wall biosynthesis